MVKPVILNKKSKCLEDALNMCPANVFSKKQNKVIVENPENCIGCEVCESVCKDIELR